MLFLLMVILLIVVIFAQNYDNNDLNQVQGGSIPQSNLYLDRNSGGPDAVALCQVVLHPDYPLESKPVFDKIKMVYDVKDIVEDCIYFGNVRIRARDHIACVVSSTPDTFYESYHGFGFISPHSLSAVLTRLIDEYLLGEKLGMVVVSGCMGSGKSTIVKEFGGLDGDEMYTEVYDDFAKRYPKDIEDSNMGGVDIQRNMEDAFYNKITIKMTEKPGQIIAVNGNPLPILAKHRYAVKLDAETIYKQRTKREIQCLHDNYKKIIKDLDDNLSTFSYNLWHIHRCRLAGVEQFPFVKKQCDGLLDYLDFHGFKILPQDEIIKEIKKILGK